MHETMRYQYQKFFFDWLEVGSWNITGLELIIIIIITDPRCFLGFIIIVDSRADGVNLMPDQNGMV